MLNTEDSVEVSQQSFQTCPKLGVLTFLEDLNRAYHRHTVALNRLSCAYTTVYGISLDRNLKRITAVVGCARFLLRRAQYLVL